MRRNLIARAGLWFAVLSTPLAHADIVNTVHNLSASGPGTIKAPGVGDVCVFCHTPHSASTTRALWNRDLPSVTYNVYESTTLEATLNQPTGASRLCLSCHDGVMALGNLRVAPGTGPVALGPLTGRASLGADLSDDHPVSFTYDMALASKRAELADPAAVSRTLPRDSTDQLQCTSCHDPHENRYRKFLRADDRSAALCSGCHKQRSWLGSVHANSAATWRGMGVDPWPNSPYATVAENGCGNCHRIHAAPGPAHLLSSARPSEVCLPCHNGNVARANLEPEFSKFSAHPVASAIPEHEPSEDPHMMPRHSTCTDCHDPHGTGVGGSGARGAPGPLRGVGGVSIAGSSVREARDDYEVCLRCHGIGERTTTGGVIREDNTRNVRLEIRPSNPSYHPIAAVGRNTTMSGFEPGYSTGSIIACTDCHNNDEWTLVSAEPRGPHGSRYAPILEREYQMNDPSVESFQTYALCYKCHNRSFLINDSARRFPHSRHVRDAGASCAVCHDAHGSRASTGLINFMLRDPTGNTVVQPSASQGRLEHIALGPGRGECYLSCHGANHEPASYP